MPVMDVRRMIVRVGDGCMRVWVSMRAFARDPLKGIGVIVVLIIMTMRMRVLEPIVLVLVAVLLAEEQHGAQDHQGCSQQ